LGKDGGRVDGNDLDSDELLDDLEIDRDPDSTADAMKVKDELGEVSPKPSRWDSLVAILLECHDHVSVGVLLTKLNRDNLLNVGQLMKHSLVVFVGVGRAEASEDVTSLK
jgi:hypothetical protein